jgi:Protein of unknown function (DUF2877)
VTAARAVWLGPGAARALRPGRHGAVEVAQPSGAYVQLAAGDYLHVCGTRAPRGPLSVAVSGLPDGLSPGWPAQVADAVLVVGPVRIAFADAERAPAAAPSPAGAADAVAAAIAAARSQVPAPAPALVPGLALLAAGDVAAAARALAGLGDGLTPAGDDVLAGYAGACAAAGRGVCVGEATAERSSPIGLAYLRCAERGELPEAAEALLRAVCAGDATAAARRARVLAGGWGASSGACLFWGLHAAWSAAAVSRT